MIINFDYEAQKINEDLKIAEGYLACEKIIISNIKKHFQSECHDSTIEDFLKKLSVHLRKEMDMHKGGNGFINCRYALGFINTLLSMPAWKSWIKATGS